MVIRASIINDGDTRDVVCDADGRLLVGGISLDGSVAIDLTDTNAALAQLIDILDPATGNFQVQVDPAFPVVVDTTNPIDINIAGIDAIFSGEGIPVRIQSADSNVDVSVSVESINATTFPNGIPVRIDGIDLTDFPNGLPINFSGISAAFPSGIPIEINAIDLVNLPDGIPINITTQSDPLLVQIDTTGGPSVVNLNTSQLTDLLNAINADNNEVFIKDANGLLSDANPLRTTSQLVDETGTPISAANPLDVAITSDVTINLEGTLETTSTSYQTGQGAVSKDALLTKPIFQIEPRVAADTWTTPVVGHESFHDVKNVQTDVIVAGNSEFTWLSANGLDVRTGLLTTPMVHAIPDSHIGFTLNLSDTKRANLPLMSDLSGHVFTRRASKRLGIANVELNTAFWANVATERIANILAGRRATDIFLFNETGQLNLYVKGSSLSGTGSIGFWLLWNPFAAGSVGSQAWDANTFQLTESAGTSNTPDIQARCFIDTNNRCTMISTPIRGRACRVIAYRISGGTINTGTLTGTFDFCPVIT
jgi:hypothetical protein